MREIKIQCDCGQKIKFDVEPVNNQMPFAVQCPVCGQDGTPKANAVLMAQGPTPMPYAPPPGLRINAPPPPPPLSLPPPPPPRPLPAPMAGAPPAPASRPIMASPLAARARQPVNSQAGMLGALVGLAIGVLVWYSIFKSGTIMILTSTSFGADYAALFVGLLTGLGAWIGGRGSDDALGQTSAFLTLAAIPVTKALCAWALTRGISFDAWWQVFKHLWQVETVLFGFLAVVLAYVVGSGVLAKVLPRN